MNRTIEYIIDQKDAGLRIEQFLRQRGYSYKNLTAIKRMPKSVIVNGEHFYMRQELHEGDLLSIVISETECSEKGRWDKGGHFGDWLSLDAGYEAAGGFTDKNLIAINHALYRHILSIRVDASS